MVNKLNDNKLIKSLHFNLEKSKLTFNYLLIKMAAKLLIDGAYKMTSDPLGFCVIINMINFDGKTELERSDSLESVYFISKTFEYLNFKIKPFQDLNDLEIKTRLNELLNSEECDSHDCFVLYIHSHGKEQGFYTSSNKIIKYDEVIQLFSDANCQKFIGKPKLVFFDCGRRKDSFYPIQSQEMDFDNQKIPLEFSDLFVCYSTIQSQYIII